MSAFDEPKIDCHVHVLDPARFPYGKDIEYKPSGQEIGTAAQLHQVMAAYGVRHCLLVQPNSGYGSDNSCLLDAIAQSQGRLKGIAIVDFEADAAALHDLKRQGVIGAAFNPTFHGLAYYRHCSRLIERLAEADMLLNLQCEGEQLSMFAPLIERIPVRVLIDHCGRPTPRAGLKQEGFPALLRLAATGRVSVKLSGYAKFSDTGYPFEDCRPYVTAIVEAFTLDRCLWASDWPFLRSSQRQDYGPLVEFAALLFPDGTARRKLFWDTPHQLLGFAQA